MRTDAEVQAAAERTADIALRLVAALRERDSARATGVALDADNARLQAHYQRADAEREELRAEVRRLRTRLANVERDRRQLTAMRNAGDVVRVPLVGRAT